MIDPIGNQWAVDKGNRHIVRFNPDAKSAEEAAVAARLIQEVHIESQQMATIPLKGMGEMTEPGGGAYVMAPLAAEQERGEKRRQKKP